ncbi:hypothetical protein BC830DRAFT_1108760 [Chytriomyces sp. MP71]|nr:hypothetical protein BC830DRAFT_1108760 [Chytriomyces sp. MP71]
MKAWNIRADLLSRGCFLARILCQLSIVLVSESVMFVHYVAACVLRFRYFEQYMSRSRSVQIPGNVNSKEKLIHMPVVGFVWLSPRTWLPF